jgi:hypothetical protein
MRRYFKLTILPIVFIVAAGIFPYSLKAQDCCLENGEFAGGGFCDPDQFPPCPTPVDGNIGLLVGVGVLYGVKKLRDERRKQTANLI